MNKPLLLELLATLSITNIQVREQNLSIPCPFAPTKHPNGRDSRPSMSISFSDAEPSLVTCFTCHTNGYLVGVLTELEKNIKGFVPEGLLQHVIEIEGKTLPGAWQKAVARHRTRLDEGEAPAAMLSDALDLVWPENFLENFRRGLPAYLTRDRGICADACRLFCTLYDRKQRRAVFPVRRQSDKALVGVVGRYLRATPPSAVPKYRDYAGFNKGHYFFGEHLLDLTLPNIILVEGPLDVLKLYSLGFRNVIGLMGAAVTSVRIEKLGFWAKPLYIASDWDDAGNDIRNLLLYALGKRIRLFSVPPVPDCKDPGDCATFEAFDASLKKSVYLFPRKRKKRLTFA